METIMPNIANVLKDEIKRLARREIKLTITPLKVSNAALKKLVYEHKRRIAALEKENKGLTNLLSKIRGPVHDNAPKREEESYRITGRQVRSLRGRLGISQTQLAKLIGVSDNIVSIWENKSGRLRLRKPRIGKVLFDLKGMKRREVLEQIRQEKKGRTVSKRKKKSKKI
jgi:DNA-binding transcriptional regulator YiaG